MLGKVSPDQGSPPTFTGQLPTPHSVYKLRRNDLLMATCAALLALAVYFATLPPTVSGEDSGELVTAAYTLGIPHPPGYPVWCLLAHPFTYLPFGTVAWRVALSSAVFGALTVFFVYLVTLKLCRKKIPAFAAALMFAFSQSAWEQFVIAEVYALGALFTIACVFLLVVWYESRKNSTLLVFALLYGLSLANHSTARLLGPPFLLFVLYIDPLPWKRWKLYAGCLALSALGLSVYLYLPIRSAANPPVDWGNPETWDNFWAVIRQEQYSFLLTQHPRSLVLFMQQLGMFFTYYATAITPFLVLAPLIGVLPLWRTDRHVSAFLTGLALLLSLGMILALNYGTDQEAVVVNDVFFIPFVMVASIFSGIGITSLGKLRVRAYSLWPATVALSAACVAVPLVSNYRANDKSKYWFAHDYASNILSTLEPNALYLPTSDHSTFPVIYLQAVQGVRPDVVIGNKYGYIEEALYADMPLEIRKDLHKIPTISEQRVIEEWIVAHNDRPVYLTEKRAFPPQQGVKMADTGLAYRVVKDGDAWKPREYWQDYKWHTLDPKDTHGEFTANMILADYHFGMARSAINEGHIEDTKDHLGQSIEIAGESPEVLNNAGSLMAEHDQFEMAADYYLQCLELHADHENALRNLGQVYMALQKYEAAELVIKRRLAIDHQDIDARRALVACLQAMKRPEEARDELLRLAQARPDDPRVYRELGMLYRTSLHNDVLAREYLMESVRLDPNQMDLSEMLRQPATSPIPNIPGLPPLPNAPGLPPQSGIAGGFQP